MQKSKSDFPKLPPYDKETGKVFFQVLRPKILEEFGIDICKYLTATRNKIIAKPTCPKLEHVKKGLYRSIADILEAEDYPPTHRGSTIFIRNDIAVMDAESVLEAVTEIIMKRHKDSGYDADLRKHLEVVSGENKIRVKQPYEEHQLEDIGPMGYGEVTEELKQYHYIWDRSEDEYGVDSGWVYKDKDNNDIPGNGSKKDIPPNEHRKNEDLPRMDELRDLRRRIEALESR